MRRLLLISLTVGVLLALASCAAAEKLTYVERKRSDSDKRKVIVSITRLGKKKLENNPSLLQEYFIDRFMELQEWEQSLVLSALQRVASMMKAERLEVSPVLTAEPIFNTSRDMADIVEVKNDNKKDTMNEI